MNEECRRAKLLIVDDTPANIKALGQALRDEYHVRVATNGIDALRIANSENPPDLILLDVLMPGMDGHEVCRRLKTESCTQAIPVIFVTAKDEESDETRGLDLGAVDYITKPFSVAIAKARIRTHLELKRVRDRLESLSSLDGLTGIANRRRLDCLLAAQWRRAANTSDLFSILMVDIDQFKAFNDTYGHLEGDDCIRRVAAELSTCMEARRGTLARYGGEEFCAILPHTGLKDACAVAEELRKRIESLRLQHGGLASALTVTISLGVATCIASEKANPNALVAEADKALYEAKKSGRNRVCARTVASQAMMNERTCPGSCLENIG
jgi:diguanylate cyclase (GGDEF)-like protein